MGVIMVSVTLDDAKIRLPELIEAVEHGETIIITKADQPVATLAPVQSAERRPRFGSAKGSILYMADDFDAPLDDFDEHMK
jgi:prevent-host-death family protein